MSEEKTLPPEYFEKIYEKDEDPWDYTSSEYEAEKYRATLKALARGRYDSAFEIGCSIGVLTERLAKKCEKLLSVDASEKAVEEAKERCKNLPNVEFRVMQIPAELPAGKFDLVLISEVGYYLSPEDWQAAMEEIFAHLAEKAQVALVHWTPPVHDYPQTGDEIHDSFAVFAEGKMRNLENGRAEKYRLDVWEKL